MSNKSRAYLKIRFNYSSSLDGYHADDGVYIYIPHLNKWAPLVVDTWYTEEKFSDEVIEMMSLLLGAQ